jgi:hypothetical protein
MKSTRLARSPLEVGLSARAGFISAGLFAAALAGRTVVFMLDFHVRHSGANVIGWPFVGDMLLLALAGTAIGVFFSARAFVIAERANDGIRRAQIALALNCLLIPLASFLVFVFPRFFISGVNFD